MVQILRYCFAFLCIEYYFIDLRAVLVKLYMYSYGFMPFSTASARILTPFAKKKQKKKKNNMTEVRHDFRSKTLPLT